MRGLPPGFYLRYPPVGAAPRILAWRGRSQKAKVTSKKKKGTTNPATPDGHVEP